MLALTPPQVYRQLEEACRAMLTSLPLVQELHHPAMRERHWQLLMQVRVRARVRCSRRRCCCRCCGGGCHLLLWRSLLN